jgi:hypothetical protein
MEKETGLIETTIKISLEIQNITVREVQPPK